jgi:UDP-N-acetylglucosamine 2-epimerase (hydrolysing)
VGKKRIVFLTGTRADFGKLKSLITITQQSEAFEVHIFATGMHMSSKYGKTVNEIYKSGFKNIYQFINHDTVEHMDRTLAKTIDGFSHYIAEIKPDLIVVHGDRVEAMAGAIVGSLNNILVAHIEGGELSGTIDELIRHAVSKMSHIHLVSNADAKKRLIQLGEREDSIFVIGSPDLDLMNPTTLPTLETVKAYYGIDFDHYAICMFHPVTTEYAHITEYARNLADAMLASEENYIVIYPNNDMGSIEILHEYERLKENPRFKIFPSLRFEYFLTLLYHSMFMIGNSSAGIREAPHYDIPSIDIGSRQKNRVNIASVFHCGYDEPAISSAIESMRILDKKQFSTEHDFGQGNSDTLFMELLQSNALWAIKHQKQFQDLGHD